MKENLLRFNNDQKYMIFDFETCSLNLGSLSNKPWQLAFALAKGKQIYKKFNYLIKWDDLELSKDARRITNFSDAKYEKGAVDPLMVLNEFEKHLYSDEYLVLGHNILGFDIYIHGIFRQLLGKKPDYSYINRCIDTLSLAKAIKKDISIDKSECFIEWQYKLINFFKKRMGVSIGALCKSYSLDFDSSKLHDALYDIDVNFQIFQKQLWQLEV